MMLKPIFTLVTLGLLVLLLASLSLAEHINPNLPTEPATVKVKPFVAVAGPAVYDVPFDVNVNMDTGTTEIIEYDLRLVGDTGVLFDTHQLLGPIPLVTGEKVDGKYRVYVQGKDLSHYIKTSSYAPTFILKNVRVQGKNNVPVKVSVDSSYNNYVVPLGSKASTGTLETYESAVIQPQLSDCGDGIVGYFDTNGNGIKDANEAEEKCDEGTNNADGEGCHNCQYAEIGYKVMPGFNCAFGSSNCALQKMDSRELLREKLTALLNGQCYPANHPDPLYCEDVDNNGVKDNFIINYAPFNAQQKIKFLAQVSAALKEYFKSPS